MVPLPKPTVPEPDVPNPVTQTIGGIKDLVAKNINPRQTFLNYAANKAFGKQGAAILGAGMGILPLAVPMIKKAAGVVTGALRPDPVKQGIAGYIDKVYGTTPTGQISTGPMAGYNVQSGFGTPGAMGSAIKRIGKIAATRRKKDSPGLQQKQKDLEEYVSDVQKQITISKGGIGASRILDRDKKPSGPPSTGFKAPKKQGQSPRGSTFSSPSKSISDRGRGQTGGRSRGGRSGGRRGGANPHL